MHVHAICLALLIYTLSSRRAQALPNALPDPNFQYAGFMPKLVEAGIDALFETLRAKEQEMLTDLLVSLLRRNAYNVDDFVAGVKSKTDQLEDLA